MNLKEDQVSVRVSEVITKMLDEKGFREIVKKKILERFDGDYNILVAELIQEKFKDQSNNLLSVEHLFRKKSQNGHSIDKGLGLNIKAEPHDLLDSILSYYPLLHLAIPEIPNATAQDWNIEKTFIPVAVSVRDETLASIPIISQNGQWSSITRNEYPSNLVMVVGYNERVTIIPKNNTFNAAYLELNTECAGDAYLTDDQNDYYLTSEYFEDQNNCNYGGAYSSIGTINITPNCERDNNPRYDRISKIKFNSMGKLREVWDKGKVDLHLKIYLGADEVGVPLLKTFGGDRGDWRSCGIFWINCKPEWFDSNAETVIWNRNEFGDRMYYRWYEYDGSSNTRTEETCWEWEDDNGVKVKRCVTETINEEDDQLGKSYPYYCDDISGNGFSYNSGDITFILRR